MSFRCIFQRVVAQIELSHPWKVPRKSTPELLFSLPKSSFGEHKVVTILQTVTKKDGTSNPPNPIGRMHCMKLALYQAVARQTVLKGVVQSRMDRLRLFSCNNIANGYKKRWNIQSTQSNRSDEWLETSRRQLVPFFWTISISSILCSPNENFGRRNKRSCVHVRCKFHGCEYSIWATRPWKLHLKCTPDLLFCLPKSSFGEHTSPQIF